MFVMEFECDFNFNISSLFLMHMSIYDVVSLLYLAITFSIVSQDYFQKWRKSNCFKSVNQRSERVQSILSEWSYTW